MKFDFNFFNKEINFLNIVVFKTHSSRLETKVYRKDSERQDYLHCKSEYTESLKWSIPCSQALRLPYICSTRNEFQNSCEKLWIPLIRISLRTKFQLRLTIVIFWITFAQKMYSKPKTEKVNSTIELCKF